MHVCAESLLQFSCRVMTDSVWPHGLQHSGLSCPSPHTKACSNSCPSMPSNHLILCRPLLLLPSIFPSIRVFSNESVIHIRWPKYWSFSFSIIPSNDMQYWFPLGLTGLISFQAKGLSRVFNTTVQKHQFFSGQLFLWSNSHIHTWLLEKNRALTRQTFVGKVSPSAFWLFPIHLLLWL